MTEVGTLGGGGVQIKLTLNVPPVKSLVLIVPAHDSQPVHSIVLYLRKKHEEQNEDWFLVVIDSASSKSIVLYCKEWPTGEPIICFSR